MADFTFDLAEICAPGAQGLKPYEPGKPSAELQRELGISNIIKLASNENPLGPSPKALAAVRNALGGLAIYPDGQAYELRHALAARHQLDPACITLGDGSDQNVELVARAFLQPGKNAVFSRHAYAMYALDTQAVGAESRITDPNPPGHPGAPFGNNLGNLLRAIDSNTRVVFIANPDNPTGTWVDGKSLRRFLEQVPPRVMVLVDEAYLEYVEEPEYPDCSLWLHDFPNLIVTRTFSKIYGLAGLRCGYAMSHARVADLLNRLRQPFNASSVAQVGALAALGDLEHLHRGVELNNAGRKQLQAGLRALELKWIPSITNFLTVDFGRPARPVYEALLRSGVIVRSLVSYGLPNHLRITIGLPEQNARVLDALKRIVAR